MTTLSPITLFKHFPAPLIQDKSDYKRRLKALQESLCRTQQAYFHQKRRALIIFEGWDASGKGGAIRRVTECLDPRGVSVYPFAKPERKDQEKHFLYRFWKHIPPLGHLTIFDRSHYGRVLVERVDNFATRAEWQRGYSEINEFEKTLNDSGVKIIKLFMHISPGEQKKRFEERLYNPYKRWKITGEDLHNRRMRHKYEESINEMFMKTNTEYAPWKIINAEYKWQARINVLDAIISQLAEGVNLSPPSLDEEFIALAKKQLSVDPSRF